MAMINFSVSNVNTFKDRCAAITWSNLNSGDEGTQVEMSGRADRSVQFTGSFGSISLMGSNDGINWSVLTDPSGNNLIITSMCIKQIMECVRYMKPVCNSGTGLNCILFMKT